MSDSRPAPQSEAETQEHHRGPAKPMDAQSYWRANLRLIAVLLSIWAAVSFGCSILFIEQLNKVNIGQLPLGFWFAQQGSIYVFVVLIFVYAWRMDKLDKKYGVTE
jgi:putative solute:sodium symporter small subunit